MNLIIFSTEWLIAVLFLCLAAPRLETRVRAQVLPRIMEKLQMSWTAPAPEPAKSNLDPAAREKIIQAALDLRGVPYLFGGNTMEAMDCSYFVQHVFKEYGVSLPRTAAGQYTHCHILRPADLQPADLVFFQTYKFGPSHVGIYLGHNEFVHASSLDGQVTVTSLSEPLYSKRFIGGGVVCF